LKAENDALEEKNAIQVLSLADHLQSPAAIFGDDAAADPASRITHLQGFSSRLSLVNSLPGSRFNSAGSTDQELIDTTRELFLEIIEEIKRDQPSVLVWDGDLLSPSSFTAIIPALYKAWDEAATQRPRLVAFVYDDPQIIENFQQSWGSFSGQYAGQLVLVTVPMKSQLVRNECTCRYTETCNVDFDGKQGAADGDARWAELGVIGMHISGSQKVFCFGGGGTTVAELRHVGESVLWQDSPVTFHVWPVMRLSSSLDSVESSMPGCTAESGTFAGSGNAILDWKTANASSK
jgi:hypothetical protein